MAAINFTARGWLAVNDLAVGHLPFVKRDGETLIPCAFLNSKTQESFEYMMLVNSRMAKNTEVDPHDLLMYLVGASKVKHMTKGEFDVIAGYTTSEAHYQRAIDAGNNFVAHVSPEQYAEISRLMWPEEPDPQLN